MNDRIVEYVRSLKPKDMPSGYDVLREGVEMGKNINVGRSLFLKEKGYKNYAEYKKEYAKQGKITWEILLGLATLEEQVDAIKKIYEFSQRTGLEVSTVQCIPSSLMALPKEYRENAPKPTSYMFDKPQEWRAHQADVPMEILFEDQMLSCPNSLDTTINALQCGSSRFGLVSQFIWGYPGFNDNKKHMIDMIKSIGIMASKRDEYIICDTYLDDGLPGYAMDCVTYVGYALLEHYLVTDLCGARHQIAWGGLLSEGQTRLAVGLAIHKLLTTDDQPALSYINSSTIMQWDHDIEANYGPAIQEILLEALMERKYKMNLTINPVSITEKIAVPTLEDLLNIFSAGARSLERISDWDDLMDWTPIEKIADRLAEEGKKFFNNVLEICETAGINTKDPLEMFMMLKNMNPSKFEPTFHHNLDDSGSVRPFYPTVLGRQTLSMKDEVIDDLYKKGLTNKELDGTRMVCVSGDGHTYGLILVDAVYSEMGAEVVNGGVDIEPSVALDLADEEGIDVICISVHIGQGLDYAKQIMELASKRNKKYHIYMGGMLNGILPGGSVPVDISDLMNETGVFASNDLYESISDIKRLQKGRQ